MSAKRWLACVVLAQSALGCAPQGPHRIGNDATEYVVADSSLCPGLPSVSRYRIPVAYVEIDEQGSFQDRGQVDRAKRRVRRSEEHTSELQSLAYLVCRLLLEK